MKNLTTFVKTMLMICFFAALAGCGQDFLTVESGKSDHGHSHD